MVKRITYIVLFSFFAISVANYVVSQFSDSKKNTLTSIEEQIEKEASNESDDLLDGDFFVFQAFIRNISLFSFRTKENVSLLNVITKGFSPHGFHAAAYLDLCVFRI